MTFVRETCFVGGPASQAAVLAAEVTPDAAMKSYLTPGERRFSAGRGPGAMMTAQRPDELIFLPGGDVLLFIYERRY
jgi:hypothetical protein